MEPYRKDFDAACAAFGWTVHTEVAPFVAEVDAWRDAAGNYLFEEENLSEGLVKELIRLAQMGAV